MERIEPDYELAIENPQEIIERYLDPDVMLFPGSLNFKMLDSLLKHDKKDYLTNIFTQFKNENNFPNSFFYQSLNKIENKTKLISYLMASDDFFAFLGNTHEDDNTAKEHLKIILEYIDIIDLDKNPTNFTLLKKYLESLSNYIEFMLSSNITEEKAKKISSILDVKIDSIDYIDDSPKQRYKWLDFTMWLSENHHLQNTLHNFAVLMAINSAGERGYDFFYQQLEEKPFTVLYKLLSDVKDLYYLFDDYWIHNTEKYVIEVIDDLSRINRKIFEDSEIMIELLRNEKITKETKNYLIDVNQSKLREIETLANIDKELILHLAMDAKIVISWDNLYFINEYSESSNDSESAIGGLINNQNSISQMIESLTQKADLDEEATDLVKRNLLLNNMIAIDRYQAILELIMKGESLPKLIEDDFSNLEHEKTKLLLQSNLIEFNEFNYNLLKANYDIELLDIYLESNISAILKDDEEIDKLTQSQVEYLVSSNNLDHNQKLQLIEATYTKFLEHSNIIHAKAMDLTKSLKFKDIELLKMILAQLKSQMKKGEIVENQVKFLKNEFDLIERLLPLIDKPFEKLVSTLHPSTVQIESKYDNLMTALENIGFVNPPRGKYYKSYNRKKV